MPLRRIHSVSAFRALGPAATQPVPASANVAVYAPGVENLEIAYKAPGGEWRRQALPNVTHGVHHGIVVDFPYGSRYGFRAAPKSEALPLSFPMLDLDDDAGQPLLLDPYGRAVDQREGFLTSVRMAGDFDWGTDQRPRLQWRNTIIYEAHVRGQSMLHPDCPRNCAEPTRAWPIRPSLSTSRASASPRSSCSRCTSTLTSRTCRTLA